jgi:hypothetical protein
MIRIQPEDFWNAYRAELRSIGRRSSLTSYTAWTGVAILAARQLFERRGLRVCQELNLDIMAYEQRVDGVNFNWDLRVAFEHENNQKGEDWIDELCKLCHVVADLRVLVSYFPEWIGFESLLTKRIDLMGHRLQRVEDSSWLLIFGPRESKRLAMPWVAYTIDSNRKLSQLPDANPFVPWRDLPL